MNFGLRKSLLSDIYERSTSAAIGFIVVALFVLFTALYSEHFTFLIRCASVVLIGLNAARIWISVQGARRREDVEKWWGLFQIVTWLNALSWGIVLALAAYDSQTAIWGLIISFSIYTAFCNASILTLSNSATLHFGFMMAISLPMMAAMVARYRLDPQQFYLSTSFFIVIIIAYALAQGRTLRKVYTEKWETSEELLRSKNALIEQRALTEHVNRLSSIGEMAAGFAHEINNPLAIVIGNLEIIESELTDKKLLDEQTGRLITKTITSASRIAKIIKGLRTLSRASAKEGFTLNYLDDILQETVVLYEQRMATVGAKFTVENLSDEAFMCDPVQISQVLVNLLGNACDEVSTHDPGERWISLKAWNKHDRIFIEVRNSGPAIKDEVKGKIFTPFFTTKPVGQGMGLGLVISRSIALQHGGELEVDNSSGATAFRMVLPLGSRDA